MSRWLRPSAGMNTKIVINGTGETRKTEIASARSGRAHGKSATTAGTMQTPSISGFQSVFSQRNGWGRGVVCGRIGTLSKWGQEKGEASVLPVI